MTVIYKETTIVLGLGSNLENRCNYLENATVLLQERLLNRIQKSSIYECNALLKKNAPKEWGKNFLNMVIKGILKQDYQLKELFKQIQSIELELGKNKLATWAPRAIDIDILAIDNLVLNEHNIIVPHTGIEQRQFVAQPLKDIEPDWQHPVTKKSIDTILSDVPKMDLFKRF